jgi:homocysteine S-methyltransferase
VEARDEFWAEESNRLGRAKPFVAASVGPYGAFLADGSEYRGNYGLTEQELMGFHHPRLKALIEACADPSIGSGQVMLACETIPSLIEAQALVKLLEEFQSIQAWISFSCRDQEHVNEGQRLEDCVRLVESSPFVVAVGVNCTSPKYIPSLIREAKKATSKPVLVYPNSGETYDALKNDWDGHPVYESFGEEAKEWYRAGARMIGGCCRTTPEDIKTIASWARNPYK